MSSYPPPPAILSGYSRGLLLGAGILLSASGGVLLSLHGDITCKEGTAREACPNVYDTRLAGSLLFGSGMISLGMGIVSLFLYDRWPTPPVKASAAPTSTSLTPSSNSTHSSASSSSSPKIQWQLPSITPVPQGGHIQWGFKF